MGILSRVEIELHMQLGNIGIDPLPQKIGPNSADLTLGPVLRVYRVPWWRRWLPARFRALDPARLPPLDDVPLEGGRWLLLPGRVYLGSTAEYTETFGFVPYIDGRSSLARLGVFAHCAAGRGDCGFCGCWTVELVPTEPVWLQPGMRLFQITYHTINGPKDTYEGRYQGDRGPVGSRLSKS